MKSPHCAFSALVGAAVLLLGYCTSSHGQSYSLSPLWSIPAQSSGYEWVSTNHTHRGLAYNTTTTHLLTVSRYPSNNAAVYILDSNNNGAVLGNLSVSGVFAEINFPLNVISVAADGVIYGCNLTVDSTNAPTGNNGPFRIYRWPDENSEPTVAYLGDPSDGDTNASNRRFGDSMIVRGSGLDTEILLGSRSGKTVTRFTTTDGSNFTHQKISAPELTGIANTMTIAFGETNTFWIKTEASPTINYPLQHFSFDPIAGTATLLQSFTNGVPVGGPLAFDPSRNLFGIIGTLTHELRLYKRTEMGFVQQGVAHSFGANPNGNNTGAVLITEDKVFALESNNGFKAFTISTNAFVPFSTTVSAQSGQVTLSWPSVSGFIYQAQRKEDLGQLSWTNVGAPANGTGSAISLTEGIGAGGEYYRVRAE